MVLFNRILNATAQRKPDQAAPEIVLDPLETLGGQCRKIYLVMSDISMVLF
jgi:E3 ubiquitin-protein ligase HECTD4